MSTLLLTQSQVRELTDMAAAVEAVEGAFAAHGAGQVLMPAKVYLDLPEHHGDFRAMPASMSGSAGVKWVNSHPENPTRFELPTVMGMYILSDPSNAAPLAVMDATWLTAARTGAAAAVASKHLALGSPRTIGFVGSGVQARVMLAAHQAIFEGLTVLCADKNHEAAQTFAQECGGSAVSVERACAADIVCTSTPSRTPVVKSEWIGDGTHLNAMGADGEGKQELETALLQRSVVVIDDYEQATHSGEINVPLHKGHFKREQIAGTLGEVVSGTKSGRSGAEITIFDSTGLAVQDVALARTIYVAANERGIGKKLNFLD